MHESTEKHTHVAMNGRWVWRREENRRKRRREQLPDLTVEDEWRREKLGGKMGKWGENISDSVVEDEWRIKQIRGKKGKKWR